MRYLVHSEDCSFDTATGKHSIVLDRRISNPTHLKVSKLVYESPTIASGVYPLAVYARSEGINDLVRRKHCVELTASNHENESNCYAVLKESQSTKRYHMAKPISFPIKQHAYVRELDFFFADNRTIIGGTVSAGETEVTAATIAARSDLFMFLNLSDAAKITTSAGGDLTQWEAVNDSTFQFVPDGGSGLTISDFGSNGGKSVDFDGAYMLKDDSTAAEPGTGTVCFLFNSQDDQMTEYYPLIDWYRWRIWVADAKLAYYGSPTLTDLSVADNTDYMVTVRRNDAGVTFELRLENMATGVVTTDSSLH